MQPPQQNRNRPGTAVGPRSATLVRAGLQDQRPRSASGTKLPQRPRSAAAAAVLQNRVNQLEQMLDLQRNEYKERVERWDQLLNRKFTMPVLGASGSGGHASVKLKSLEEYVADEEMKNSTEAGGRNNRAAGTSNGKNKENRNTANVGNHNNIAIARNNKLNRNKSAGRKGNKRSKQGGLVDGGGAAASSRNKQSHNQQQNTTTHNRMRVEGNNELNSNTTSVEDSTSTEENAVATIDALKPPPDIVQHHSHLLLDVEGDEEDSAGVEQRQMEDGDRNNHHPGRPYGTNTAPLGSFTFSRDGRDTDVENGGLHTAGGNDNMQIEQNNYDVEPEFGMGPAAGTTSSRNAATAILQGTAAIGGQQQNNIYPAATSQHLYNLPSSAGNTTNKTPSSPSSYRGQQHLGGAGTVPKSQCTTARFSNGAGAQDEQFSYRTPTSGAGGGFGGAVVVPALTTTLGTNVKTATSSSSSAAAKPRGQDDQQEAQHQPEPSRTSSSQFLFNTYEPPDENSATSDLDDDVDPDDNPGQRRPTSGRNAKGGRKKKQSSSAQLANKYQATGIDFDKKNNPAQLAATQRSAARTLSPSPDTRRGRAGRPSSSSPRGPAGAGGSSSAQKMNGARGSSANRNSNSPSGGPRGGTNKTDRTNDDPGPMLRSPPGMRDHRLGSNSPPRSHRALHQERMEDHFAHNYNPGFYGSNNHGHDVMHMNFASTRPQSAAPAKNRWTVHAHKEQMQALSNRPRTAPYGSSAHQVANQRDKDESYNALSNLQQMFTKVHKENQVLIQQKLNVETELREYLSTKEGHMAKQIFEQRDLVKSLRTRLYNMEQDNVRATAKAKRCERRAYEEEMFLKQAMKEIETLKQVTVELQRMNLELHESPQMKLIEQKLYKFQKGLTKRTKELNDQNDAQDEAVQEIWVRVEKVNTKVDGLYAMTEALQQDRNEAGVLLKVGRERIKECKQTLQKLAQDFQQLKQNADDSERKYQRILKRQDEETNKINALQRTYREILEEVVGNNKWYKRTNKDLENENAQLKKENTELLESLMAYLMLNQQSSLLKGKAKKALDPLTVTAEKKRVPPPLDNRKANEKDDDGNAHKSSISTQPYPIHEPIDLPPPPEGALLSPRVLVEGKNVPILLGEIVDVNC